MPTKSITSNQTVRIAELAAVAARNATYSALEQVSLDSETAQEKIITNGGEFQTLISEGCAALIESTIKRMSGWKHPQAELIEKYFAEVLDYTLDLSGVVFPEKKGFATYMAVPIDLDEDQIHLRIADHFDVGASSFSDPTAGNINRELGQVRPQHFYVFAHVGGDEPDARHLGKSYFDAMMSGVIFMNAKEYLLVTGFHRWINKDHFMDMEGKTLTSSLWPEMFDYPVVTGDFKSYHDDGLFSLYLEHEEKDSYNSGWGPRELVLG